MRADTADARHFVETGWLKFPDDPALRDWLTATTPAALSAVHDPANANWLRCDGTWFAGVNVLPNHVRGAVAASGPLRGRAVEFLRQLGLPTQNWDRGQVSVVYPGYPRQGAGETDAAFRFRRDRDAAHVDGLLPIGPDRRRMLREPHAFVLGLPVTATNAGASPMVVWQGSHRIMRRALSAALRGRPPQVWPDTDLTAAYHAARREILKVCPRVPVHAQPGEAYLLHRLTLHGVAPWATGASAPPEGRAIVYFRPQLPGPISDWLLRD